MFTKKDGLTFQDLLALKDAGLVFTNELSFRFEATVAGDNSALLYGPLILTIERSKATPALGCDVGVLTRVGTELLQLLNIEPDLDYIEVVQKGFDADGVAFAWARLSSIVGSTFHFGTKTYIKPPAA